MSGLPLGSRLLVASCSHFVGLLVESFVSSLSLAQWGAWHTLLTALPLDTIQAWLTGHRPPYKTLIISLPPPCKKIYGFPQDERLGIWWWGRIQRCLWKLYMAASPVLENIQDSSRDGCVWCRVPGTARLVWHRTLWAPIPDLGQCWQSDATQLVPSARDNV